MQKLLQPDPRPIKVSPRC